MSRPSYTLSLLVHGTLAAACLTACGVSSEGSAREVTLSPVPAPLPTWMPAPIAGPVTAESLAESLRAAAQQRNDDAGTGARITSVLCVEMRRPMTFTCTAGFLDGRRPTSITVDVAPDGTWAAHG